MRASGLGNAFRWLMSVSLNRFGLGILDLDGLYLVSMDCLNPVSVGYFPMIMLSIGTRKAFPTPGKHFRDRWHAYYRSHDPGVGRRLGDSDSVTDHN